MTDQTHLIFVYGTLKRNFGVERVHKTYLGDRKMVGMCAVKGVMVHLGAYPGLADDDVCQVTGEVYECEAKDIQAMDRYEGYPLNYSRKQVDTPWGKAWCYFKTAVPVPMPDNLVCVDRGIWQGGERDRAPYRQVRDFYANKRWQQPEYRNMQVTPIVANVIPESSPEKRVGETENKVVVPSLPVRVVQPKIEVGPGVEMM